MSDIGVGDKVECIRDDWVAWVPEAPRPILGTIYTIKEFDLNPDYVELVECHLVNGVCPVYLLSYFRPIRPGDTAKFIEALEIDRKAFDRVGVEG